MKNLDQRIIDLLNKRGITTTKQIEEYLHPSISFLRDPKNLGDMQKATRRINQAISNNETIVIYGDYDTDGVSASAILYTYLKSRGATPHVFIPNRFEDGYGLSTETINHIAENFFPDLLITVDCGITAVPETEMLTELGIDVIITDHHIPGETLPNALAIIDPKTCAQTYGFSELCGAGVALKLVQALGGNPMDYIDIAALATIGDIVPLVDENRVIATLGLSKINSANCNLGLSALKELCCQTTTLTSQDVSFKLVPRLNSTGRMKDSMPSFHLLVSTDRTQAEQLAQQIDKCNQTRIDAINTSIEAINNQLKSIDLSQSPCIITSSPSFHQGVLGILAARLVGDYGVPAFVFTQTADGSFKGSCRSTNNYDIHQVLSSLKYLCEALGGHKMAAGLTIKAQNFDTFCDLLKQKVKQTFVPESVSEPAYDILATEADISTDFAQQLQIFEPTGCGNEKPVLKICTKGFKYIQTSNPKHYQIQTQSGKRLMCFNGQKYQPLVGQKQAYAYFNLSTEIYNNQIRPKALVSSIYQQSVQALPQDPSLAQISTAQTTKGPNKINIAQNSEQLLSIAKQKAEQGSVLVVTTQYQTFLTYTSELGLNGAYFVPSNQQSQVVYLPTIPPDPQQLLAYKTLILADGTISNTICHKNAYSFISKPNDLKTDRNIFADCYRVFLASGSKQFNNITEYVQSIKQNLQYSPSQIAFCLSVFDQLQLLNTTGPNSTFAVSQNKTAGHKDLTQSQLYQAIQNN